MAIVLDTFITPFPDYKNNPSYQSILAELKQRGLLDMDLRAAYPDLNVHLDPIYDVINGMTLPDPAVQKQILSEVSGAMNIRSMSANLDTFTQATIFTDSLRLSYVGNMIKVEDNDACTFNPAAIVSASSRKVIGFGPVMW